MKLLKSFLWLIFFISCFVVHLTIANALPIVHPDNGVYVLRPECALDKVLAVQDAGKNWGANVIIDNSNSNASTWKLTKVDGDWYTITAVHSDLSLNVADTQTSTPAGNGFNVSTTSYNGENQNKFRFLDAGNGYYVIQAKIPGDYVLDVYYAANRAGNNVWCYALNNTPAQKWKLERPNSLSDPLFQKRTVTISDGWYRIQPMHDLSRSVDAAGGNNNIHMWDNLDVPQQKFYLQNRGNGYFSLQTAQDNKFFVTADGRGNGANLYITSWNNSDSQLFRLIEAGNNSYHIFSKVGVNLNFDCAGGGRSNGNNVQLWTTEDSAWHKWKFTQVNVNSKANFQMESYNLSCHSDHQLKFTGRLWNANNNSEITGIHVYIGGGVGAGGEFIGEFRADKDNHRFDSTLNVPSNRNGSQLVVIYAVNGIESKELDRRNINVSLLSEDNSRTNIQKKLMQAVFHTTQGTRVSTGGDFDGYINLKKNYGWIHEGIDLVWYYKAPVYAAISGEIVRAGDPSFNTVAIYDKTNNITVVYLHFDSIASGIYEGKKVDKNTLIGYQGYKGAPNPTPEGSHVHIEIRLGKQNCAAKSKDQHQDNPNPYPYWNKLL